MFATTTTTTISSTTMEEQDLGPCGLKQYHYYCFKQGQGNNQWKRIRCNLHRSSLHSISNAIDIIEGWVDPSISD